MKFCEKCGQQVDDTTSYCPNCGYHFTDSNSSDDYSNNSFGSSQSTGNSNNSFSSTNNIPPDNSVNNESPAIGISSLVCGVLSGFISAFWVPGLILGIIGLTKRKKKSNRITSLIGLILSIIAFLFAASQIE